MIAYSIEASGAELGAAVVIYCLVCAADAGRWASIRHSHGIYGCWGWRGIVTYLIGFACMVAFFNVGDRVRGLAARALGGANI